MNKALVYISRKPDKAVKALYRSIENSLKIEGKECILIVPDQYKVEAEQALLDFLGSSVLMRVQVKSFRNLASDILSLFISKDTKFLTDRASRMLIRLLMEKEGANGDWKAFSKEVRGQGFLSLLSDQLKEFKEYGISSDDLMDMAQKLDEGALSRLKLEESAKMMDLYEQAISGRFFDRDDRLKKAYSCLGKLNKQDAYLADTDFFFEHFYSLSKTESLAMQAIMEIGPCKIAMVYDDKMAELLTEVPEDLNESELLTMMDSLCPDAGAFALSTHFFRQIRRAALEAGSDFSYESIDDEKDSFAAMANSVFSYRPEMQTINQESLVCKEFRNTDKEIEGLDIEINKLVINEGARYKDIQVILLDDAEYGPLVRRKFNKNSIPFFMDENKAVHYHPLIKLIEALVEIAVKGPRKDLYLKFIKSGMTGIGEDRISAYRDYVESHKLEGSMLDQAAYFTLDEVYAKRLDETEAEDLRAETDLANSVRETILDILKPVRAMKSDKLINLCRDFYNFLDSPRIKEAYLAYDLKLDQAGKNEELALHRQVRDEIVDMLDELVTIGGDETVSPETFSKLLAEGLEGMKLGVIPPYQDGVFVSPLGRSRSRKRPYIFIIGINDKNLPSSQSPQGIFSQSEKEDFIDKGFFLPSMPDFMAREEALNFYLALRKVDKRIYFFTSKKDSENESLSPSIWLKTILKYCNAKLQIIKDFKMEDYLYSRSLRLNDLAERIRQAEDKGQDKKSPERILELMSIQEDSSDGGLIKTALNYKNDRPDLSAILTGHFFENRLRFSATEFEQYAACPYKSFVRRILKAEEKRTLEYNPLDLGNLLHMTFSDWASYVNSLILEGKDLSLKESEERAKDFLMGSVDLIMDSHKKNYPANAFLIKMAQKTMLENHGQIYKQLENTKLIEIENEVDFGRGRKYPGLVLGYRDRDRMPIYIEGRIDRVDKIPVEILDQETGEPHLQVYTRVVDYKTSGKQFNLTKVLNGLDLQLLLYLKAATAHSQAWGCFYMPLKPWGIIDLGLEKNRKKFEKNEDTDLSMDLKLDGIITDMEAAQEAGDFTIERKRLAKNSQIYKLGSSRTIPHPDGKGGLVTDENDPKEQTRIFSDKELKILMDSTLEKAKNLYQKEKEGKIDPNPYRSRDKETACQFCPYRSICRFEPRGQFSKYRQLETVKIEDWKGRQR